MTKEQMSLLRQELGELVVTRQKLGEYDANASTIMKIADALYEITGHILETSEWPRRRSPPKD